MPWKAVQGPRPKPPVRIESGSKGSDIKLETNFFPIQTNNKDTWLIHYEVTIKRGKKNVGCKDELLLLPRRLKMQIFELLKDQHPSIFKGAFAFDCDRNAYSVDVIPELDGGAMFEVDVPGLDKVDSFRVNFEEKSRAYLSDLFRALSRKSDPLLSVPLNAFQMLEVMFRHYRSLKYELVGRRSFYAVNGDFGTLNLMGQNKEGFVGFFGSMRPAAWKDGSILLNMDVSHTAFYREQPLVDFIYSEMKCSFERPMNLRDKQKLLKELVGIKVQSTHTPYSRTYRIIDISSLGSNRQQIAVKDEATGNTNNMSVEHYLRDVYGKKLKYPYFNCFQLAPRDRNVYLPIEVLKIPKGERVTKRLNDRETAQFIRDTAIRPDDRRRQIVNIVKKNNFRQDPMLRDLQFTVDDKPLDIHGRVLPPPNVLMDQEVTPLDGVWDMRQRRFYRGGSVNAWVIINYDKSIGKNEVWKFASSLMQCARQKGISFVEPLDIIETSRPVPEQDMRQAARTFKDLDLIMVIVTKGDDLYARIKKSGDMDVGIITQCVQGLNVKSCKPATVNNLILKINAKLDGINNIIAKDNRMWIFQRPVMIMGADVNHPPAGDKETPSLAAVVGSINMFASKYATEVRTQEHRVEMIKDIKDMTRNLLKTFYQKNKKMKPERLIMYRDGVSESQFMEVLSFEMIAMREACKDLEEGYEPGITFIVVQKRHHARFFCERNMGVGRCLNIPPGTVVDTDVTHPKERDFYLCSHQGIQGTSKPTHYHVLWDDNDINLDDLQSLTYSLCHMYNRCTRAVSLPNAAYYAHLAAYRAKVHITDTDHDTDRPTKEELKKAATVDRKNPLSHKFYYV